jgi:hypothetical protein
MSATSIFYIDCERMPGAGDLKGHEAKFIDKCLGKVQVIRGQQTKLFDYLLTTHPTEFTFLAQSCEDRTGHWLYPIIRRSTLATMRALIVRQDAFPNQYVADSLVHLRHRTAKADEGTRPDGNLRELRQ